VCMRIFRVLIRVRKREKEWARAV